MLVPAMRSTDVKEMQLLQETTLTLLDLLESGLFMELTLSTEELKSALKSLKVIGCGQPFGSFQLKANMEPGPHLEKSTLWNPVVTKTAQD